MPASLEQWALYPWVASNCTSNWNGNLFRIDRRRQSVSNVLDQSVSAFSGEDVKIAVEGDTVSFKYGTDMLDTVVNVRAGIARYRIDGRHAIRHAPIASSFAGLLDEWLRMSDADAHRSAFVEANTHHRQAAARFNGDLINWQRVADCPGSPPSRELTIQSDKSKQTASFRIRASSAAEMRMESVTDKPSPACREIDMGKELSRILTEPPLHAARIVR